MTDEHFVEDISPLILRSPECLIGVPWDTKTDIWSLGLIIIQMLVGSVVFTGEASGTKYGCDGRGNDAPYDTGVHLKQMTTVLGPLAKSLLDRADKDRQWYLKSIFNDDGTIWGYEECNKLPLEDLFPFMHGQEKDDFLAFIRKMMQLDPKDRASAEDLLTEPWLQDVLLDSTQNAKADATPSAQSTSEIT